MKPVDPNLFVVFGGTGDLMQRKLLPALYHLTAKDRLGDRFFILGVARADLDDERFRTLSREALSEADLPDHGASSAWCDQHLYYHCLGDGEPSDFEALKARIEQVEQDHHLPGNRVFYLALPPGAFPPTITGLGESGLGQSNGWTRLVVEKPFGRDLASARALNHHIHQYFDESQVYRIDHYLGKETVQNLLVFRFANPMFESVWNRDRVDNVQITVAESLGVGTRAGYYDKAGALRDMIQNHLTQLLTLTAMEAPPAFDADAIRDEKVKVLRSIKGLNTTSAVFGQYSRGVGFNGQVTPAYTEEKGVAAQSSTETFAALRLEINNWRWQGVPFYLRTGKRMNRRLTQIIVNFREPPVSLFQTYEHCRLHSNALVLTIQPNEGFALSFDVKAPGQGMKLETHNLHFEYEEAFGHLPDGYETLLFDILISDQTLFVRADEVEAAWSLYAPLLEEAVPLHPYDPGGWGPREAARLVAQNGDRWLTVL